MSVILPKKAKHYFKSLGLKSKNDKIDARGLAQMAAQQNLDTWKPISPQIQELRALTRYYNTLQEQKRFLVIKFMPLSIVIIRIKPF